MLCEKIGLPLSSLDLSLDSGSFHFTQAIQPQENLLNSFPGGFGFHVTFL